MVYEAGTPAPSAERRRFDGLQARPPEMFESFPASDGPDRHRGPQQAALRWGRRKGVVSRLIGALSEFGKLGILCIALSHEEAEALYRRMTEGWIGRATRSDAQN